MRDLIAALLLCSVLPATGLAADRFAAIVENGGEPTVTKGGFLVNQKRAAVQKELTARPPTAQELGVKLPPGSRLMLEQSSRQIAQYHPDWRIYQYSVTMPRSALIAHFQDQGLRYDESNANLKFGNGADDFIDGLSPKDRHQFRIWRRPR